MGQYDQDDKILADFDLPSSIINSLFKQHPDPMWIFDVISMKFLIINKAATECYGYSENEFSELTIEDIRPKNDREGLREMIIKNDGGGWTDHGIWRHKKKSGETFLTNIYTQDLVCKDQQVRFTWAVSKDIKGIVNIQTRALNEIICKQKEQLDDILSSVKEIIFSCKASNLELVYINNACYDIYGYTPDELLGQANIIYRLIHPDDIRSLDEALVYLHIHRRHSLQCRVYDKSRKLKYIVIHAIIRTNTDTGDEFINGVITDITKEKEAERELKQSEKQFRIVAENPILGIGWTTPEGVVINVNEAFAKMIGYLPEEIQGVHFAAFSHPDDVTIEANYIEKMWSGELDNYQIEKRFITKHGEILWAELILSCVRSAAGDIEYLIGIVKNINDRKKIEGERDKLTNDLLQRNKDLEQFTYIISHNLRSPVASITGLIDILNNLYVSEEEKSEIILGISQSVQMLDQMIIDLNHILQVRNDVSEKKEIVHFSQLVKDISFTISKTIEKEHVQIRTDFSDVDELFTLKTYLHSIFYNLISNSIKYGKPGIPPYIRLSSKIKDTKILLVFEDNGLGIDLAAQGRDVFGLYKRFHKHIEGKGLGLFMVKTQVETIGGKISIASEVGVGTTFTIELEV